jgi:hypothetical protein
MQVFTVRLAPEDAARFIRAVSARQQELDERRTKAGDDSAESPVATRRADALMDLITKAQDTELRSIASTGARSPAARAHGSAAPAARSPVTGRDGSRAGRRMPAIRSACGSRARSAWCASTAGWRSPR